MPTNSYQQMWEAAQYYPLFLDIGMTYPVETGLVQIFGETQQRMFLYAERGHLQAYYDVRDMEASARIGEAHFLDASFFRAFADRHAELAVSVPAFCATVQSQHSSVRALFREGRMLQQEVMSRYSATQPEYLEGVSRRIDRALSCVGGNVQEIKAQLVMPTAVSTITRERRAWLEALVAFGGNPHVDVRSFLEEHARQFGHLTAVEGGSALQADDLAYTWESDVRKGGAAHRDELHALMGRPEALQAEKDDIARAFALPASTITMCSIVADLAHMRLEERVLWTRMDYVLKELLRELAGELRRTYEDLLWYRAGEIDGALETGSHVASEELQKRREAYALIKDGPSFTFSSGEDARAVRAAAIPESGAVPDDAVRGTTAYAGRYVGKVTVVRWGNVENVDIPAGGVLVAGQTRPNMMALVRKAGAIVTDEGGVTCHAAIVARELRIPCIIGTKRATKELRDGDTVEVDATNGVVRVLSRAT